MALSAIAALMQPKPTPVPTQLETDVTTCLLACANLHDHATLFARTIQGAASRSGHGAIIQAMDAETRTAYMNTLAQFETIWTVLSSAPMPEIPVEAAPAPDPEAQPEPQPEA